MGADDRSPAGVRFAQRRGDDAAALKRTVGQQAAALLVPSRLAVVTAERDAEVQVNPALPDTNRPWLLVNGRCPGLGEMAQVKQLAVGEALCQADGQVVAAHLSATQAPRWRGADFQGSLKDTATTVRTLSEDVLFDRPWHVLARGWRMRCAPICRRASCLA